MKASARLDVVRREDKEERLRAFILGVLANLKQPGDPAGVGCLLVARSIESPVVRVLISLAREAHMPELRVCALLTAGGSALKAGEPIRLISEASTYRTGHDSRLLDAHELLVIGQTAVWTGDSMRRDPSQTDSYECYSEHCVETAARALASFGRLWRVADAPRPIAPMVEALVDALAQAPAPVWVKVPSLVVAPTRH